MAVGRNVKVKKGMAGSCCGKGRYELTEYLKKVSKRKRRKEGKQEVEKQLKWVG